MNKKLTLYQEVFLAFYNKFTYRPEEVNYFNLAVTGTASLYVSYLLIDLEAKGYIFLDKDYCKNNTKEYHPICLQLAKNVYFQLTLMGFRYGKKFS